jgi:protoporphyrinogen oxidase
MRKKRIVIVGAGLSGLSVAWHLAQRGREALILEKEREPGGLCRSKQKDGFVFDYCGHLLHFKKKYTLRLVKRLLGNNLRRIKRSAWVYHSGGYIPYPFQAHLDWLPEGIRKECLEGFIHRSSYKKSTTRARRNFYDWVLATFGKGTARHFMLPYNAKFWKVPLTQITCDWIDGLIPTVNPRQSRLRAGIQRYGYNHHFWYPKQGGIGSLSAALAGSLNTVFTNAEVVEINTKEKTVRTSNGMKEKFETLILTLPLPLIKNIITPLPQPIKQLCGRLRFNSIFNLNLGVDTKDTSERHWAYYPQQDISFFRVGFFHNFSPSAARDGRSALYAEAAYRADLPLPLSRMCGLMQEDLQKTGVLSCEKKVLAQDSNVIEFGYPVYDFNYRPVLKALFTHLLRHDIIPCGRYGAWRYASMEDVILEGKDVAGRL